MTESFKKLMTGSTGPGNSGKKEGKHQNTDTGAYHIESVGNQGERETSKKPQE